MTNGKNTENQQPAEEPRREIDFQCRVCGRMKSLTEMRVIARLFPPLVVCPDCEQKML